MATTINEIAMAAGVSKAVISKVLNNSKTNVRVSAKREAQIRELAEKMGYVPNAHARMLLRKKSETIGVYFEHLAGLASGPLYIAELLDGLCEEIFRRQYRVALITDLDKENSVAVLGDGRLDGVIWCRLSRDEQTLGILDRSPIPIVALTDPGSSRVGNAVFVFCDNAVGTECAVEHLWDLGHRRIAFLHEGDETNLADCVDRKSGFVTALKNRGVEVLPKDILAWSWDMDELPKWWASQPSHTAVIAWTESCAGRFLAASKGIIEVPRDLSLIGFDSTHFCESTHPRLTAVRQPIREMATTAARELFARLDGKDCSSSRYILPCILDIRSSTDVPRR